MGVSVESLGFSHHHGGDLRRRHVVCDRGFELALDAGDEPLDARAVDRALAAGDLDAAHQFLAVEGLARPTGLEHRDLAQLDAFEGGEARAAILALAAAADRRAVLGRTAVLHLTDRKSTRLNSSHSCASRMPSSA